MLHAYVDRASGATHLALVKGDIPAGGETLVRVHEPLSVLDFLDPGSKRSRSRSTRHRRHWPRTATASSC
jgi:GTP cyclohydrolase II